MKISNANSAALDNQLCLTGRVWTPRRGVALVTAVFVLIICWQVDSVRLSTVFQRSTAEALWTLLRGLFPPDLSFGFLRIVSRALLSTLATGIAGTFLSVLIAIPLAALSTPILWRRGNLVSADEGNLASTLRAAASRAVLAFLGFLRAIPDLVWGLLFVTAVGLGSLAGTLALAVSYTGVLGGSMPTLSPMWIRVRSRRCRPSEQRVGRSSCAVSGRRLVPLSRRIPFILLSAVSAPLRFWVSLVPEVLGTRSVFPCGYSSTGRP